VRWPRVRGLTRGERASYSESVVTDQVVLSALRNVKDPSGSDIVSLGLVKDLEVRGSQVSFTLVFTNQPAGLKVELHSSAKRIVAQLAGVTDVQARMGPAQASGHTHGPQAAGHAHGPGPAPGPQPPAAALIPDVKHTIAVSSGKGGVGKSTVAVNLAMALRGSGATVGMIDADAYGPDVPLMLGSRGRPAMFENRIIPVEAHGVKMMSIGLLVDEREPLIWRGPMLHSFIQQMLRDVMWGPLDYLVFDMPPGTGDAQLSLSQSIPLSGAVMVTTPQDVALLDVRRAVGMFRKLNVPLLGIVENMSYFVCPHCQERSHIFGAEGGAKVAQEYGVPLLAQIPLDPETRIGGDEGMPITIRRPRSAQAAAFRQLAEAVVAGLDEGGAFKLPSIS
jgi:ATP-binding protein involved in chromosome partitioning